MTWQMKFLFMKIPTTIVAVFIILNLGAQNSLPNTRWKGTLLIPDAVDVLLTFKRDTLYITNESGAGIATIYFESRKDTLLIRKIAGPSPCPEQAQGLYRIEWLENGNKLRLHGVSDECEGRIGVFTVNPFEKVREQ